MKKKIVMGALAVTAVLSGTCLAQITPQQVAIGDIAPGDSIAEITAAYGEPVTYDNGEKLVFADGLVVEVDSDRPGVVEKVVVHKENGIATPDGLTVGMEESALTGIYGPADDIDYNSRHTEYEYYSNDGATKLEVKTRDGRVVAISCELRD